MVAWERGSGRRDVQLRGEVSGSRFIDESAASNDPWSGPDERYPNKDVRSGYTPDWEALAHRQSEGHKEGRKEGKSQERREMVPEALDERPASKE